MKAAQQIMRTCKTSSKIVQYGGISFAVGVDFSPKKPSNNRFKLTAQAGRWCELVSPVKWVYTWANRASSWAAAG